MGASASWTASAFQAVSFSAFTDVISDSFAGLGSLSFVSPSKEVGGPGRMVAPPVMCVFGIYSIKIIVSEPIKGFLNLD